MSNPSAKFKIPGSFIDPETYRRTAVNGSSVREYEPIIPDLSSTDRDYLLLQAGKIGDIQAITALVLHEKADINFQEESTGKSVAFFLIEAGQGQKLTTLKQLGADLNLLDKNGRNISFEIVLHGTLADLILVDNLHVNLCLTDKFGFNLFHILSISNRKQLDIGYYLHEKNINHAALAKNGMSPLTLDIALNKGKELFDFYISLME